MKKLLHIRPLEESESALVSNLIPAEWNFDLEQFLKFHAEKEAYRAFGGFIDEKLVCFGDVIINGNSGWLANIVVKPDYRTKGFGQTLTMYLVNYLKNQDCKTILTMASDTTKVNYQKLGFLTSSMYCILKGLILHTPRESKQIRPVEMRDHDLLFEMDLIASNEDRRKFFNGTVNNGWVYESPEPGKILGFFLPNAGEGPVVASDIPAGLQLLQLKHSLFLQDAIIPCENKVAVDFLKENHFRETGLIHRMFIGEDMDLRQDMIFSRAGRFGT